jgi:two-component system, LuxR family, response regulator FixJ
MQNDTTVYVVDDDSAVCRSIERLVQSADMQIVIYTAPLAFLEAASSLSNGCILLDVRMPEMNGLALQARLSELGVTLPIIMMTAHGDVRTAVKALKAGAVDFIEKPFSGELLLSVLRTAQKGATQASEIAAAAKRTATLSNREREVLDALVAGKPNKVIAFHLGISPRTVEVHRRRMMRRLGVRHLSEAVRIAVLARLRSEPASPKGR